MYGQIPLPAFNWVKASQTEVSSVRRGAEAGEPAIAQRSSVPGPRRGGATVPVLAQGHLADPWMSGSRLRPGRVS